MTKSYKLLTTIFAAVIVVVFASSALGVAQSKILSYPEGYEEQGYEHGPAIQKSTTPGEYPLVSEALPDSSDVLLIPESGDDYIGMYDPYSGDFLGVFISDFESFSTPICAMEGPDGNIYISDQVADAVFIFDREGNYIQTYADASDGLNNIRGIDFREDHLFVTSGDDYVAEFISPHTRELNFIEDGSDPFDILFMDDGRSLLSDIQGSTDNVRWYRDSGFLYRQLYSTNFPEQIAFDPTEENHFLCASFSDDVITFFNLDTMCIQHQIPFDGGRGVFRLGNGNILATNGDGVFELDPETGAVIDVKSGGSCRFIELIPALYQTDVSEPGSSIPTSYALLENYPNPFNASTLIKYELPQVSYVTIEIFDILGRKISTIQDGFKPAGHHQVIWNANNVSSGVYFYKISADSFNATRKMMLVK